MCVSNHPRLLRLKPICRNNHRNPSTSILFVAMRRNTSIVKRIFIVPLYCQDLLSTSNTKIPHNHTYHHDNIRWFFHEQDSVLCLWNVDFANERCQSMFDVFGIPIRFERADCTLIDFVIVGRQQPYCGPSVSSMPSVRPDSFVLRSLRLGIPPTAEYLFETHPGLCQGLFQVAHCRCDLGMDGTPFDEIEDSCYDTHRTRKHSVATTRLAGIQGQVPTMSRLQKRIHQPYMACSGTIASKAWEQLTTRGISHPGNGPAQTQGRSKARLVDRFVSTRIGFLFLDAVPSPTLLSVLATIGAHEGQNFPKTRQHGFQKQHGPHQTHAHV